MSKPIVWTIAGSDSGGGAGIQADLKTFHALGAYGCSVVTALTAQNTTGISRIEYQSDDMMEAQLSALANDLHPAAVKIGMLGTASVIRKVAAHLASIQPFTVLDPVLVSSSGTSLVEKDALEAMIQHLLPHVDLLTPNIAEAEALLGRRIEHHAQMPDAATDLLKCGVSSVLLKGGHAPGGFCQDFWTDGRLRLWITSPRQDVADSHGTGCTLSSAIAACKALNFSELDALVIAKAFVNQGLRGTLHVGRGRKPLSHTGWPTDPRDLPWITHRADDARARIVFPGIGSERIGLYPVVDRAAWLRKLLPLGVRTIQLRIKDLGNTMLEEEIRAGIDAARHFNANLYINDHWSLALKHGAYGVHLGQEDLPGSDLRALAAAGIRLGVSTRSYFELAQAMSVQPSYVAIGSVFPTASKTIDYDPLGLGHFRRLRKLIDLPVVAIGGITLEQAENVWLAGADGMAVISDVVNAPNPSARAGDWLKFFANPPRRDEGERTG